MSNLKTQGVLEAFNKIKHEGFTKAKKENFEFDISGIDGTYENNDSNARFVLDVAEGTTAGLVQPYVGVRGQQVLDIIDVDPTWKTDGQDAITSAGVGKFDGNVAAGSVDFTDVTLSVEQEYFQIKINPYRLDKTVYGLEVTGNLDPNLAAAAQIMEAGERQMRNRVATRFFSGFGASANNGLNDLTFAESDNSSGTNGPITKSNILGALEGMWQDLLATTSAVRNDNVILLNPTDYGFYIGAIIEGKYPALLNDRTLAGQGETLSSIPFLFDASITVITDSTYTGEPKLFQADKVYFGTTALAANEQMDLWYSRDFGAYFLRGVIYGGVQTIDNSGFFTPDVTA